MTRLHVTDVHVTDVNVTDVNVTDVNVYFCLGGIENDRSEV